MNDAVFVSHFNVAHGALFDLDGHRCAFDGIGRVTDLSTTRLYALRAVYALIAIAMGAMTWPAIIMQSGDWSFEAGVIKCMLGALTLLCLLGIRYPLQMLPLLFWEMAWKTIWLLAVALPNWIAGSVDAVMAENIVATALVILVYAAVPWHYVFHHYVRHAGDRWKAAH